MDMRAIRQLHFSRIMFCHVAFRFFKIIIFLVEKKFYALSKILNRPKIRYILAIVSFLPKFYQNHLPKLCHFFYFKAIFHRKTEKGLEVSWYSLQKFSYLQDLQLCRQV